MSGVGLALLCALCWAAGSVSMKDLSRKLDPFTLNAPRALIAGLALLAVAVATGRSTGYRDLSTEGVLLMVGSMAVGGGLGDSLYVLSMSRIGLSRAYPIAGTYPAITLLLAILFMREAVTWDLVLGLGLVVGGVMLISRPTSVEDLTIGSPARRVGIGLAMLAATCWAGSAIMLGPGAQGVDPIVVSSIRIPALALMFWGLVAVRRSGRALLALSRREWVTMIVGGLVGWGLGSLLFVAAIASLGPTRTAVLTSTSPLFAIPLTAMFLKERPTRAVMLGTAVTVAGVALVS